MSEKISEASKSEIAEIAERIAEMSVEILGKVDEFGTETHSSVVSVAGSYDDALEKINKLNLELETNEETTEEQKKEILFRKWELLQGGKSNIATVKPTINARTSYLDEIEKIKLEIQSKINKEIIPKLESIQQSYNTANENKRLNSMSDDAENMSTSSGALEDEATSFLSDDSNSSLESVLAATSPDCAASEDAVEEADQLEPDSKPKIDLANLTRYTRPQMLEMRCSSTQKHLERLETLRILNPNKVQVPLEWPANPHLHNLYNLSETDRFLLQLLSLSSVQREDFILKEAEMRKLLVTKRNNLNLPYYDLNDKIRGEYNKCQAEVREKIMAYMQPKQTKPPKQERRGPSASPALSQFSESSPGLSQSPKPFNFNFDVNTPEKPKNRRTKTKKVFEFSSPDYQINEKKGEVQNDVAYKESFLDLFRHSFGPEGISNDFDDIIKYLVDSGKASLLEGELRVNAKNWNEGYVTQKGGNDVLVSTVILRKWALHGDVVKVLVRNNLGEVPAESGLDDTITSGSDLEVASKEKPHPRLGVVISIMEQHHTRETIGTFPMVAGKKRQQSFQPRDTKLPTVLINLNDTQISTHILYMVEITHWLKFQPYGKVVKTIGQVNTLDCENTAILLKHNLDPQPYSDEIVASVPQVPFEIPASEYAYREDLRKKCIFSIDPDTARDLDDAMSCEVLPNGNWEIGVHISDVSFFLKEDDPLDLLVKEKATTIYLVNQVYHMLPVPLCLLCSLLPGDDKMAYTVWWEIDPETAEILSTRFARSVVHSCAQLSYKHAQDVIENPDKDWTSPEDIATFPKIYNGFTPADLAKIIHKLQKLALILRANRMKNGALRIDQPKISFHLKKENGMPLSFFQYVIKDSNRLIEEFMLLANISVAKFIHEKYPDISIMRAHETPSDSNLTKLRKLLAKQGLNFDTSSSSSMSKCVDKIIEGATDRDAMNAVINVLVSKSMTRAKYFCSHNVEEESEFWHFGLSIPMYTHFTSPIRRYSDILVHRVLNAALGYEPAPQRPTDELDALAAICNVQKYNAKMAGEDSSLLYLLHFIQRETKDKTGMKMKAGVVGIYPYNFEVILQETGHIIKAYYKNLEANGEVCVNVNEEDLSTVTVLFLNKKIVREIVFGTELNVEVKVHKNKMIVNRIVAD